MNLDSPLFVDFQSHFVTVFEIQVKERQTLEPSKHFKKTLPEKKIEKLKLSNEIQNET